MTNHDSILWTPHARVLKYEPEMVAEITKDLGHAPSGPELRWLEDNYGLEPDSIAESAGNVLTTVGLARITSLICGAGGGAFTSTLGFVGVGATSTTGVAGDVALGSNGASAWHRALDASPTFTGSGVTINANSTFASGEGNFAWNEWCWGVLSSGTVTGSATLASVGTGAMILNHKAGVALLGTKVSGAVWTLQATVTLT